MTNIQAEQSLIHRTTSKYVVGNRCEIPVRALSGYSSSLPIKELPTLGRHRRLHEEIFEPMHVAGTSFELTAAARAYTEKTAMVIFDPDKISFCPRNINQAPIEDVEKLLLTHHKVTKDVLTETGGTSVTLSVNGGAFKSLPDILHFQLVVSRDDADWRQIELTQVEELDPILYKLWSDNTGGVKISNELPQFLEQSVTGCRDLFAINEAKVTPAGTCLIPFIKRPETTEEASKELEAWKKSREWFDSQWRVIGMDDPSRQCSAIGVLSDNNNDVLFAMPAIKIGEFVHGGGQEALHRGVMTSNPRKFNGEETEQYYGFGKLMARIYG